MAKFKVGELAIMQNAGYFEEWNGALGVIVGGLARRNPMNLNTMKRDSIMAYSVRPLVKGAIKLSCQPYQLRKLREPGEERPISADQETPETATA